MALQENQTQEEINKARREKTQKINRWEWKVRRKDTKKRGETQFWINGAASGEKK